MKRRASALAVRGADVVAALVAVALGGCQLVSGLAEVEVASTTGSGGHGPTYPCSPDPATCPESASPCLALAMPPPSSPVTLRVAQLNLLHPDSLYGTNVKNAIFVNVTMNLPRCELNGLGTFSWLMEIDTKGGTLRTGAAKPAADPREGYAFVDEVIDSGGVPIHAAPVELALTSGAAGGAFTAEGAEESYLPLYFDPDATQAAILPIRSLRIKGTLSPDRACIGSYEPSGLLTSNDCIGDRQHPGYIDGGTIEGYVLLEEADSLIAGPFNQSLCVLLSGDTSKYGDGSIPTAHCARDASGAIVFEGDWCSKTNGPREDGCADALQLYTGFAAAAVKLVGSSP
ncbi:MAG: hypothetical protein U0359_02680 [Byssovorax sp.]